MGPKRPTLKMVSLSPNVQLEMTVYRMTNDYLKYDHLKHD